MHQKYYPEPVVGLFIFNPEGEIFLFKTHKWKGLYCVPGGHIEWGETMKQALVREAKEEAGLDIYDCKLFKIIEFLPDGSFWKEKHMIFLNHLCKTKSTEVTLNDEAQSFVWVNPEEALKLPLEKYTKQTLEEFLTKKPNW